MKSRQESAIGLRVLMTADREIITELFTDAFTGEPWNDDWSDTELLKRIGESGGLKE